jgi:hypothetical protein
MPQKKINILCFLDVDRGRDAELLIPLIYFSEKFLNANIDFSFMWNIHDIYRKKPDLILMANTIGSILHFKVTKYAVDNCIKIFALISEGIFRTNGTFNYFGYNTDKQFYQEYICHWSDRTKIFLQNELPQIKDKNVTTGATGFDRYLIYNFKNKDEFLKERNLQKYSKVIGYAGWAFGKIYNKQGREELKVINKDVEARIKWIEEQMYLVEDMLRFVIEKNPDILFILKRHPNEANPTITVENPNEMIRLREYENVLYFTENENLHDLISVSDIWVGFESTTVIEAWLMGKQTLFINPDPNFNRTEIYKGNPVLKTPEEFNQNITEYYNTGNLPLFHSEEMQKNRKIIIKDTIGFSDGKNHIRASYYLKKVLDSIDAGSGEKRKIKLSGEHLFKYLLLMIGKYFYNKKLFLALPKFKKTVWMFESWRLQNVRKLKSVYSADLDQFYKEQEIMKKFKDGSLWNEIFSDLQNPN